MPINEMISGFLTAIESGPNRAQNLIGLAELAFSKKERFQAFELARRAFKDASCDANVEIRAKALLGSLLPAYHTPMMNDVRRNHAWDQALRRAIRPGMHVLEIGSGAGMLALMAARAGAEKVITCEKDPVAAEIAREICECNGYGNRIQIITKRSQDLVLGTDLDRPADLLFCDIFADNMFGFDPLPALADARNRLLVPDAPVIPGGGTIRLALANWEACASTCRANCAAGFDISAFADLLRPSITVAIGDPSISLRSPEIDVFRFDFGLPAHPDTARAELSLDADQDGIVDGIIQWIRLELDSEISLEARPEPGAIFFSSPRFWPFSNSLKMRRRETIGIIAEYRGAYLSIRRS